MQHFRIMLFTALYSRRDIKLSTVLLKRFIQLVRSITWKLLTLHNWKYVT